VRGLPVLLPPTLVPRVVCAEGKVAEKLGSECEVRLRHRSHFSACGCHTICRLVANGIDSFMHWHRQSHRGRTRAMSTLRFTGGDP
jgi:hypothetical protein